MSIELTQCPACKLFVSLRGYDYHIMRCDPFPGCCSASSPCAHKKISPDTLCEVCQKAAALSAADGAK